MTSKLTVKIKQPNLGKGWYKVPTNPYHTVAHTDQMLMAWIRDTQPDAEAIQIIREYPLKKEAK